ncbi:DUF421 domain-containing protein [Clostridium neuense]|uniref:DUF421 domain-containing protein n=1 Tax=Clostridium neuense TaxID=1728934 RepID=A0ABW8TBC3_9CLOT
MIIVMIRTIILYFLVVLTMRIMGKRQIGQLQPFELVIAIMISELASLPMQDTRIPLIHGIIPIITLLVLEIILSVLQLKSEKARSILCGKPTILINNGKIDYYALKNQRINMNDLLEELRLKSFFNINDIEFAILETSGQLSIIPKTPLNPTTKKDLNIQSSQEVLPVTLILDGKINYESLNLINKDYNWLVNELKKQSIDSPKDAFIAILDSNQKFYCQKYIRIKEEQS